MKELLKEEFEREIEKVSSLKEGSEEHSRAVQDLDKLYRLSMEDRKIEQEIELKKEELKSQKVDRYIKYGMGASGFVLTNLFYDIWHRRGLKFEETGAIASGVVKDFMKNIKPFKR